MPLLEYDMSGKWSDYAVAWAEKKSFLHLEIYLNSEDSWSIYEIL